MVNLRTVVRNVAGRFGYLTRVVTTESVVALTFDDGPDPVSTPALLDVLARHGAHATFFLDGPAAERSPALVHRIQLEGHAIGLHGWGHMSAAHDSKMRRLRPQLRDIRHGAKAVGLRSKLYRPPYGHESLWTRPAAWLLGHRLVYWNVSVEDWNVSPPDQLADRIHGEMSSGAIVLLHDRLRHAEDSDAFDRWYLVDAVDQVLARVAEDVQFVTVPELLARGTPIVRHRHREASPLAPMVEQPA